MSNRTCRARTALALSGAALLASSALVAVGATPASAAVQTYFAAPDGSGSECSQGAPCSLTGARDKVRSLTAAMSDDIVVSLRGGTYRLTEPLTLTPEDSGTGGSQVIWQAHPGEKPVFSGAAKITGWQSHDEARQIYRAPVAAGTVSRQLFVNGVRAVRARGPLNPSGFKVTSTGFTTPDASYGSWGNPTAVEIVARNHWKHLRCPVISITAAGLGSELTLAQPCFGNGGGAPYPQFYFPHNGSSQPGLDRVTWVENAYELLDQPGEFYLNSAAGYVYYIPRHGEDLNSATTELPITQTLVSMAGTPGRLALVNDADPSITYTGAWHTSTGRPYGDHRDDVHYTLTNGASATISFIGTGIDVLSETNSDQGDIDVYVDGVFDRTVSAHNSGARRRAQQVIYSRTGLPDGTHTVQLFKKSGQYMPIDGYVPVTAPIKPVHDIALRGITFAYTTWLGPNSPDGYRDSQGGTYWTGSPAVVSSIPAAVTVSRGQRIEISGGELIHLGGSGADISDGTQDSAVTGNRISDVSGIGVNVGEYDDYWLTDPARMTAGNTVDNNAISYVGQEYEDAVGALVGYGRKIILAHNDISHTPYSGISFGWGWGWDSPYGQGQRHGTSYAQGNHITANRVHDVMKVIDDGATIYTLGGQGDGSVKSIITGNVLSVVSTDAHGIYLDEGASWWNVSNNVVSQVAINWFNIWTGSTHDSTVHDNYSDLTNHGNAGTNVPLTNTTYVTDGVWPDGARTIVGAAGLEAAYQHLAAPDAYLGNDGSFGDLLAPMRITYGGNWQHSRQRKGNLNSDVRYTQNNGASVTFAFIGTGIRVLGERYVDQGTLAVTLDGNPVGAVDTTTGGARQYQQTIYQIRNLPYGAHTVTLTKQSGQYATIDGYLLDRSINNHHRSLTYTGAWHTLGGRGFGDFQDDVHYTNTNGDSVTATWNGTGIDVVTERYSDQGDIDVYVDGQYRTTVNTTRPTRLAQQVVYTIDDLPPGPHTIRLVKKNGAYMVIDRFTVR